MWWEIASAIPNWKEIITSCHVKTYDGKFGSCDAASSGHQCSFTKVIVGNSHRSDTRFAMV